MELHLKQWRNQQESSEQQQHQQPTGAKMPKLVQFEQQRQQQQQQQHQHQHQPQHHPSTGSTTLPLFVPENPNTFSKPTNLSAFSDSSTRFPTSNTRMGSYFSMGQWQELELQALIYRYMLAGATVPPELLHQIKKSLLHSPPYHFLRHPLAHHLQHYPQYQPASLLPSGYWGRAAMDPEPGRCRRTDGKKWRCSRDVVAGQKYCERHMHRGRNRSRKPVEIPTSNTTNNGGARGGAGGSSTLKTGDTIAATPLTSVSGLGGHFALSGSSPSIDLFQPNQSSESKSFFQAHSEDNRSDGRILRHFFDDWPRSLQDGGDNAGGSNATSMNSSTALSISMPGNASSDVSLKLATGNMDEPSPVSDRNPERDHPHQMNGWAAGGWSQHMGGPLAEALRSSTSHSSPTSVLHHLPRGSASETSYVST